MSTLIALVEDDQDQRHNYAKAILGKGYQVVEYADRKSAAAGIALQAPALVVLDIVLHDEVDAGFQLCRDLLALYPDLPVIFLTERIDEIDRISGLRLGAWDYLPKPISLAFLAEKVASLLRLAQLRTIRQATTDIKTVGLLSMEEVTMEVSWQQQRVPLTVTEFQLLTCLLKRPARAVSYDSLMTATRQQYVTANTINTHMRNIRRKFRQLDAAFDAIHNEYGFGYRWQDMRDPTAVAAK